MQKNMIAVIAAAILMVTGIGTGEAQENADETRYVPVETFTCNFKEGKSMTDLDGVIDQWSDWMDDQEVEDYTAITLTPHYYGEQSFDVAWLGAWKDGNAMGEGSDLWVNKGGELAAKFWEVLDCPSHSNFAAILLTPPPDDDEDDDNTFVMDFSNCSVGEGKNFDDVMAALREWSSYQGDNGFQNSSYMMFPVFGESNNDYEFKLLNGYDDHTALGANYELMGNGGHWRKQSELMDEVMDCDIARLYNAVSRREWVDDE